MTPRKRKSRIYWRERGGDRRAYFDGRDFQDVGGKLEPLVAAGERMATTDPDVAMRLASDRLEQLEAARKRRAFNGGRAVETQLAAFARLHLIAKKRAGKVTDQWLAMAELSLDRAVAYFGAMRELDTVRVSHVRGWISWLEALTTPQERRLGPGTIRHHLNALSNLYRRAQEEEVVFPGYNPVAALMEKPAAPPIGGTTLDAVAMDRLRSEWAVGAFRSLRSAGKAYGVSDVVAGRILRSAQPPRSHGTTPPTRRY
jgi:hypothetical protein